jgi:hypothetical protein
MSTVFHVNNNVDDEDYLKRGAEEIIAEFVTATVVTDTESPPVIFNQRLPIYLFLMINQC